MSGPVILTHVTVKITYTSAPTEILLECNATAFELTPSTEDIDVGVFCAPSLSDQGRTTWTSVLTLLWEPALYTKLQPHVGHVGTIYVFPQANITSPSNWIRFDTRYAAQPWGRFEVGQRVEVDLPLAVLTEPFMGTAP